MGYWQDVVMPKLLLQWPWTASENSHSIKLDEILQLKYVLILFSITDNIVLIFAMCMCYYKGVL